MQVVSQGDEAQLQMIRERNQMGDEPEGANKSGAVAAAAAQASNEDEKKQ